ncbi:hypothetical protein [Emticicia sp. BO119]|uniref:hypothetical protein n=1 Tax=Emticicia sp. BO119 TaxID=2757768 RepID=UPI0015F111CD|nr:hypothetical protein [Emticicia sp. BO119]MBA4852016.1 hypothetical protein [Emticicia sp. BO119]
MVKPAIRKLKGYAFDPSLSIRLDTAQVNRVIYTIEWEDLERVSDDPDSKHFNQSLPIGEYIEIFDIDPASGEMWYPPVDLNNKYLLAQDGLEPSVSNPQFHQQMVYAVIMTTIKNFEYALGRKIQWAERTVPKKDDPLMPEYKFVRRIRVFPHALRQANAYYNPFKKSMLFGYFPAQPARPDLHIPGGTIFTCLSHDIIAHETTHAILDGLKRRYIDDTHPDTRAFHEAFADIVALFQHFTFPEVLKHQIAKTRGDLNSQNLLGQLAEEFGKAMGGHGSLRDAIGHTDPNTGKWTPHIPNTSDYATKLEFHERGSILVAAVFEVFLNIYKSKIRKYLRLATNGTGVLPEGELHPDLVDILAKDASSTALTVLRICIRAIDYCPPIDITFGDYLRAIITSDMDAVPNDTENIRIAFIEAFQRRGIFPKGIKAMAAESLVYENCPELNLGDTNAKVFNDFLKEFKNAIGYETNRENIHNITKAFIAGSGATKQGIHGRINSKFIQSPGGERFKELTGLNFEQNKPDCEEKGFKFSSWSSTASYSVESLLLANRITPDGRINNHVIVALVQKRGIKASIEDDVFRIDSYFVPKSEENFNQSHNEFIFRGGCTLIFDLDTEKLKYAICKNINDESRMEAQFRYRSGYFNPDAGSTYFDDHMLINLSGPFAFMHSH